MLNSNDIISYTKFLSDIPKYINSNVIIDCCGEDPIIVRKLLVYDKKVLTDLPSPTYIDSLAQIHQQISLAYIELLNRVPDIEGYLHIIRGILYGYNIEEIREQMIKSEEYLVCPQKQGGKIKINDYISLKDTDSFINKLVDHTSDDPQFIRDRNEAILDMYNKFGIVSWYTFHGDLKHRYLYNFIFDQMTIDELCDDKIRIRKQCKTWIELIDYLYLNILERNPDILGFGIALKNLVNGNQTVSSLIYNLHHSEEYRDRYYSKRTVKQLNDSIPRLHINEDSNIRVKYVGPIGISGYCRAVKNIVKSLVSVGIHVIFEVNDIYGLRVDKVDKDDRFLFSLRDGSDSTNKDQHDFDILVIHSVPDHWSELINKYSKPDTLIYGITVWETDSVPDVWLSQLRQVDMISVPSEWNADVFRQSLPDKQIVSVYHPISVDMKQNDATKCPKFNMINPNDYMFYTINEWNGRKGIQELLDIYHEEFSGNDSVILYIKTYGNVKRETGHAYLKSLQDKHENPPRVILNYDILSSDEIEAIHKRGNCYITLTKAEGMGYGLCEAGMYGKPIISTFYGAQGEYIKGAYFVNNGIVPAVYCSRFDPSHSKCSPDQFGCLFNGLYVPTKQKWGSPYLEEAKRLMRYVYDKKIIQGNPMTKEYLEDNFNLERVGMKFKESFEQLLQLPHKSRDNVYSKHYVHQTLMYALLTDIISVLKDKLIAIGKTYQGWLACQDLLPNSYSMNFGLKDISTIDMDGLSLKGIDSYKDTDRVYLYRKDGCAIGKEYKWPFLHIKQVNIDVTESSLSTSQIPILVPTLSFDSPHYVAVHKEIDIKDVDDEEDLFII